MPNINKAYTWAINTCNAPNIGYSQSYRNQQTVRGVTYYDCSSFINYALLAGGFSTPGYAPTSNAFTTYTMPSVLSALGFKSYAPTSTFEWKAGDIGLSDSHTEMCYKGGKGTGIFMGAHTDNALLQYQVSIGSSSGNATYARTFPVCYRYGNGADAEVTGYSAHVISAICGNFWTESNVNPGVWESLTPVAWDAVWNNNTGGYGLGQWTNTGGDTHGRLYKLHEYLVANGYADDSMEGQAAYILEENVWHKGTDYQQAITYATLEEFLNSTSTDLNYLTKAWLYCWEGIANNTLANRQSQAKKAYDYINAHANDAAITEYYHTNNYLSEAQILNNCVMLYRIMGGLGGGGGTESEPKHKMPLWMRIRYHY